MMPDATSPRPPLPLPNPVVQGLVAVGQRFGQQGHVPATSGNFSCKVGADRLALTASGHHKGRLQPEHIMQTTLQGQPLEAQQPSAETALHVQLYERYPWVNAVLHSHARSAVLATLCLAQHDTVTLQGYELLKALPNITTHDTSLTLPVVPNSQCMAALTDTVAQALVRWPDAPAYLIHGHGLYTWGATLADAERYHEALDALFQLELARQRLLPIP
jgi:methylthioribulose-1-phosphate dehydratase